MFYFVNTTRNTKCGKNFMFFSSSKKIKYGTRCKFFVFNLFFMQLQLAIYIFFSLFFTKTWKREDRGSSNREKSLLTNHKSLHGVKFWFLMSNVISHAHTHTYAQQTHSLPTLASVSWKEFCHWVFFYMLFPFKVMPLQYQFFFDQKLFLF